MLREHNKCFQWDVAVCCISKLLESAAHLHTIVYYTIKQWWRTQQQWYKFKLDWTQFANGNEVVVDQQLQLHTTTLYHDNRTHNAFGSRATNSTHIQLMQSSQCNFRISQNQVVLVLRNIIPKAKSHFFLVKRWTSVVCHFLPFTSGLFGTSSSHVAVFSPHPAECVWTTVLH